MNQNPKSPQIPAAPDENAENAGYRAAPAPAYRPDMLAFSPEDMARAEAAFQATIENRGVDPRITEFDKATTAAGNAAIAENEAAKKPGGVL